MNKNQKSPTRNPKRKKSEIVCRCNNVSRETIEKSILNGAKTMNEIFDDTTAGVGPCGGSCRRKIKPFLDHYLSTGEFPDEIRKPEDPNKTRR